MSAETSGKYAMLAKSKTECGTRERAEKKLDILSVLLAATIYLLMAMAPAMAENQALSTANAALKSGKYSFVVKTIDKALKSGSLDTKDMSRALLYRGLAYQSLNKSAQSIADLTNAVWMGGLTQSEKAEALKYRSRAFDAGGISARAKADKADAARLTSGQPKGQSLVGKPTNPVKTASKPKSGFGSGLGTGISDFFGNIIPGSSSAKKPVPAVKSAPAVKASAPPVAPAIVAAVPPIAIAPKVALPPVTVSPKTAAKAVTRAVQPAPAPATPDRTSARTMRSAASIAASKARSAARTAALNRRRQITSAPATSGWSTDVNQVASAPAKKPATGSGLGLGGVSDFFGNIFGGSKNASTVKKSAPKTTVPASVAKSAPIRTAALDIKKASPAAKVPAQGRYKLQIATVRSKEEASTIMNSLRSRYGTVIAKHPARIDEAVVGNMGTFYRVRLEAFKSKKTALRTCNKLRASGLDCFPVAR